MSPTPNALKQWMDFYTQAMGGPMGSTNGWQGQANQANYAGDRLNWAQQMAQQQQQPDQMPDYFANVPSNAQPPMSPQTGYNRLAALMGRRN